MAARKAVTPTVDIEMLVKLFVIVESFESTEENPTGTPEIAEEAGLSIADTFNFLGLLEDAELIVSEGRGLTIKWWIAIPDVSEENAESIAKEALNGFVPEVPQQATKALPAPAESKSANVFKPAPDALPKGTQVTLGDGSVGTVIADEVIKIKVLNIPAMVDQLTVLRDAASNDPTNYEIPEEIDLPPLPAGVNENIWDMAHNSFGKSERDTYSARLHWMKKSAEQFAA